MSYAISKTVNGKLGEWEPKVREALKEKGFGILTEIDVQSILKAKLDVDFYPYKIIGACNPKFAYEALQTEERIGAMLPCNVILREKEAGSVEISANDPIVSMQGVGNVNLEKIAGGVKNLLSRMMENL